MTPVTSVLVQWILSGLLPLIGHGRSDSGILSHIDIVIVRILRFAKAVYCPTFCNEPYSTLL